MQELGILLAAIWVPWGDGSGDVPREMPPVPPGSPQTGRRVQHRDGPRLQETLILKLGSCWVVVPWEKDKGCAPLAGTK